jgi:Flp pilus assembly protein TadB
MPEAEQIPGTDPANRREQHPRLLAQRNLWGLAALAGLFLVGVGPARAQMPFIWIILAVVAGAFLAGCLWRMSRAHNRGAHGH